LKILSRMHRADQGRARLHGASRHCWSRRPVFIRSLTGRENIFLNCAILDDGRAEIAATVDAIVAFSENWAAS